MIRVSVWLSRKDCRARGVHKFKRGDRQGFPHQFGSVSDENGEFHEWMAVPFYMTTRIASVRLVDVQHRASIT